MSATILNEKSEGKLTANATLTVANETADLPEVKICLYNPSDTVDWIPVGTGVFMVRKTGQPVKWYAPTGKELDSYLLKAFKPAFIDEFLCAATVKRGDSVAIRGSKGSYTCEKV